MTSDRSLRERALGWLHVIGEYLAEGFKILGWMAVPVGWIPPPIPRAVPPTAGPWAGPPQEIEQSGEDQHARETATPA